MKAEFIKRCRQELEANAHKGNWDNWKPNIKEFTKELIWHEAKLHAALLTGDLCSIQHYAADIANFCSKAFEQAETAKTGKKPLYDCYGDLVGYEDDYGHGFSIAGIVADTEKTKKSEKRKTKTFTAVRDDDY